MKHKNVLWIVSVVAGLLALMLAGGQASARLPAQGACVPPCWGELVCQPVGPGGFECQEHCRCPGGETPGATVVGTPFVVTPQPSPTPPPGGSVEWCLPDECPPGETRLWLVWYLYNLGTYVPVRPLEPCCGPSCPCGEPTEEDQPCLPGTETVCSEWGASVRASLPVWRANREPYPRALVTLPEEVWVSDAAGNPVTTLPAVATWGSPVDPGEDDCACRADGSCDDDPPPEGTICEFKLGLKADPGNEPPAWNFDGCGTRVGWRAQCDWNRSSWGNPELGVGMAPDCPALPAYTVQATVPYWWSFARQWDSWEQVGQDCECQCHGGAGVNECAGEEGLCVNAPDTEHWVNVCEPTYSWKHNGPDWVLLDLTDYGWPTPYMLNPSVQLIPHPPCEPNPPVGVIYVPCIEVQAPIERQP